MNLGFFNNIQENQLFKFLVYLGKVMLLLSVISVIVRLAEWLVLTYLGSELIDFGSVLRFGLYHDFLTNCFLSLAWSLLSYLFRLHSAKLKLIIDLVGAFLYTTIQFCLLIFFIKSSYLLGAEVQIQSLSNQIIVINTAIKWWDYLYTFLFLGLFFIGAKKLFTYKVERLNLLWIAIAILAIAVLPNNIAHLTKIKDQKFFDDRKSFSLGNNKITYLIASNYMLSEDNITLVKSYPFYKSKDSISVLSEYFEIGDYKPNIVIIVVESLSSSFSGKGNYLGSYTPFLDSLSTKSLVWNNNLSCSERTYGVLPNILGSAIYGGRKGFIHSTQSDFKEYANHSSLIDELNNNGYSSEFYYGGDPRFDHMWYYLNKIGVKQFFTKDQFESENIVESHGSAWGFDDDYVFTRSLKVLESPFCKIILTTGIHSPFDQKIQDYKNIKCDFNKEIAASIIKCDQNLETYFSKVKNTAYYKNTIFVITGDHNIGELKVKNPLEIFHTPLIIYSPLLKKTNEFESIVSHRDIAPSLCSLLEHNFKLKISDYLSFMGNQLSIEDGFSLKTQMPLCLYQGTKNVNLISEKYFLLDNQVYEITDNKLNAKRIENKSIKEKLIKLKEKMVIQDLSALEFGMKPKN